jgi:hypothetical protein
MESQRHCAPKRRPGSLGIVVVKAGLNLLNRMALLCVIFQHSAGREPAKIPAPILFRGGRAATITPCGFHLVV